MLIMHKLDRPDSLACRRMSKLPQFLFEVFSEFCLLSFSQTRNSIIMDKLFLRVELED